MRKPFVSLALLTLLAGCQGEVVDPGADTRGHSAPTPATVAANRQRAKALPCMCRGNSTTTSSAVAWNMAFYGLICKRRGMCPSCGARPMAESAALLVDDVQRNQPIRQLSPWMACSRAMQEQLPRVLNFPFQLWWNYARRRHNIQA